MLFSSVLKVYFHRSLKRLALKMLISIPLKHIDSNLAVVFGSQDDICSRLSCHIGGICEGIAELLILQEKRVFFFE